MSDKPYSGPVVAIAGAGRMGRGIAVASALAGVKSQIIDLKQRSADDEIALRAAALGEVHGAINMLADIGMVERSNIERICANVEFSDLSALHHCDLSLIHI